MDEQRSRLSQYGREVRGGGCNAQAWFCASFVHPTICDTFVTMHVRVMLVICGFLAAHFVDDAGLMDLRSRGLSTANVVSLHIAMGERVNQLLAILPSMLRNTSIRWVRSLSWLLYWLSELSGARVAHSESGLPA